MEIGDEMRRFAVYSDGVTEIGDLTRIANLYPRVIRLGHFEKTAFIPKRQIENTQICIQTYSSSDSPELLIDGIPYHVSCPRVLVKRCGEIHEIPAAGSVSSFYFVYASGAGVEKMIPADLVCGSIVFTPRLQTLIGQVTELCRHPGDHGVCDRIDEGCFAILQEIILTLAARNNPPEKSEQQIGKILSWLQIHFCEPVNWEALALKFGFSERSFLRHWQKCVNCSPKEYLLKLRFAKAENMLSDSHLKISEIAAMIGYGSAESFINAFRKRYGISPLAYRKRFWLP